MLNELRAMLEATEVIMDDDANLMLNAVKNDNEFIKDTFLNDPEVMTIGGENDPVIKKFIDNIPEDDEIEPITNKDIQKITESMIPETSIEYDYVMPDSTTESYTEYDDEISLEGSFTDSLAANERCEAFYKKWRQANAEKDQKKANKMWKELKHEHPKVAREYDKIGNDGLMDKFFLGPSNIGLIFKKDGIKRSTKNTIKMQEIYIDYMIKKTAGEDVGYFKDYYIKAFGVRFK